MALGDKSAHNELHSDNAQIQEQQRRNDWNYKYDFGTKATADERQLESARKERYMNERALIPARPDSEAAVPNTERPPAQRRMPLVPSIPTSQSPP